VLFRSRNLVLTFTDDARWEDLGGCATFVDKVEKLRSAPWGGSTDFYAAMQRIADVVRKSKLKQEDIPNLLVISDMQFNEAGDFSSGRSSGGVFSGGGYHRHSRYSSSWRDEQDERSRWGTAFERIKRLFFSLGMEVHGAPLQPPTIIFWNVRGAIGYPASADEEGVVLLSGYSPALMKFILSGELEEEVQGEAESESDGEGGRVAKKRRVQVTPVETMRRVLYEDAMNPVREALLSLPATDLEVHTGDILRGVVHEAVRGVDSRDGGKGGDRRGGRGRGFGRGRGRR